MKPLSNHLTVSEIFPLEGRPWAEKLWKLGWSGPLVALGVFLWRRAPASWSTATEDGFLPFLLAFVSFTIGALLPFNRYRYLDLRNREMVTTTHYAGIPVGRQHCPFKDFSSIVVRHLCHSGEGEDSYTASIGLRPANGDRVFWLRTFPANIDNIPAEAFAFARELREVTGFPMNGPLPENTPCA